jgi:hypothetical protein
LSEGADAIDRITVGTSKWNVELSKIASNSSIQRLLTLTQGLGIGVLPAAGLKQSGQSGALSPVAQVTPNDLARDIADRMGIPDLEEQLKERDKLIDELTKPPPLVKAQGGDGAGALGEELGRDLKDEMKKFMPTVKDLLDQLRGPNIVRDAAPVGEMIGKAIGDSMGAAMRDRWQDVTGRLAVARGASRLGQLLGGLSGRTAGGLAGFSLFEDAPRQAANQIGANAGVTGSAERARAIAQGQFSARMTGEQKELKEANKQLKNLGRIVDDIKQNVANVVIEQVTSFLGRG